MLNHWKSYEPATLHTQVMNVKNNSGLNVFSIVVTYNGMEWIDQCLESLLVSTLKTSILVVDNASGDGTPEHIQKKYPGISLIRSEENLGFGRANNIALQMALKQGADYVFLLNQDARIEPDAISLLIEKHFNSPEYAVLSPVHLNGEGTGLDYLFSEYLYQSGHKSQNIKSLTQTSESVILDISMVNAAAWLMSRRVLLEIGGFNPYFFHYGEDTEYLNRCAYHKLRAGVVAGAIIRHAREQVEGGSRAKGKWRRYCEIMYLDPCNNRLSGYFAGKFIREIISNLYHGRFGEISEMVNVVIKLLPKRRNLKAMRSSLREKSSHFISGS